MPQGHDVKKVLYGSSSARVEVSHRLVATRLIVAETGASPAPLRSTAAPPGPRPSRIVEDLAVTLPRQPPLHVGP